MVERTRRWLMHVFIGMLCLGCGCQVFNTTREIRSAEQMVDVSFENERAQELFNKAVQTTQGDVTNVKRIGVPSFSLYSRNEVLAWNANCNDHIKRMDTDGDLRITEQEAQSHYNALPSETRR